MKTTQIFQTTDYNKFRLSSENRNISLAATKKMMASMSQNGWLPAYPMHVVSRDGKLVIIDGQHRFTVAQKLGIPALYVVCKDNPDMSISDINIAQKPWNNVDFANSHANKGNVNYTMLLEFATRHHLPIGVSAKLLQGFGGAKSTGTVQIRDGTFKVKHRERAESIATVVSSLLPFVKWAANSSFVTALTKAVVVKGFDCPHFLARCKANPGLLVLQPTTDAFLDMIERIYNYRSSTASKLSIKFEAMKACSKS